MPHPIIAIDGPAASGKGTLSRNIAEKLHYAHMDTGSLYRAVAFEVLEADGDPENESDSVRAAQSLTKKIGEASSPSSILDNPKLREDDVAVGASKVAAIQRVRDRLVTLQRDFAQNPGEGYEGAVLDGRDIGTVICPEASVKLYVIADIEIRAERRMKELQSKGIAATSGTVLEDMRARDARDTERKSSPLKPAEDAVMVDTSQLSESEVLEKALEIIQEKLSGPTIS
ncbi:MAG: cytidylate kinase [Micavibrio sp.]|nr:MAG: cytidylate kinase [Micavibrio sp.]